MTEITVSFDEPFYGGDAGSGTFSSANIDGSMVAINGRVYPIDTASNRYNQRAIDVLQQRNTADNRDLLLLPQNIWRQQTSGWHYGAGQSNLDRDDAIQSRFEDSFGIDPWTKWQISLLPETLELQETTGSTFLTLHNGYLVVVNDNMTYWWEDFGTMSASVSVGSVPVVDVADDGAVINMVNTDGDVFSLDGPAGTPVLQYSFAGTSMLAYVKDYLIADRDNALYNITTYASPVLIYTNPDPSFRWVDACSGPNAIYVLGGSGDRWVVHRLGIKEDGTGLNPAIVAAELPEGEIGYKIEAYLGYVFIGTDKGVRMAQPDANGDLTLGPIIPTAEPVRAFEGQGQFVWYGISSMDPGYVPVNSDQSDVFPTSPVPGLGRMDLATFTTGALAPAYANDVAAWGEAAAPVTAVTTWLGKRVFAVSGAGVFYEGVDKCLGGWLTQGTMSFSVEDLKAALYMQVKWVPDCSGRLNLDLAYDSSAYARFARINVSPDSIRSDNINLYGTKFSRVNLRIVMTRCPVDNTKCPIPSRWELRAFPVKGRASRWEVPVLIADEVDINGMVEVRNPLTDKNSLVSLIQNGTVFQYQESGQSYQVLARDFLWQPERLSTTGNGWQGTFMIVLEEVV